MVYATRLGGGRCGQNAFEHQLRGLGITQKNGAPNHPQTQSKIQRFLQTLKEWLSGRPRANTLTDLNDQLAKFRQSTTTTALTGRWARRAPATAYTATPRQDRP